MGQEIKTSTTGLKTQTRTIVGVILAVAALIGGGLLASRIFITSPDDTEGLPPTNPRLLRVAAVKVPFAGLSESYLTQVLDKFTALLSAHPQTDLVVFPEFLLLCPGSSGRDCAIVVDCTTQPCTLTADTAYGNMIKNFLDSLFAIARVSGTNLALVLDERIHPDPVLYPNLPDPSYFETAIIVNDQGQVISKKRRADCAVPNPTPADIDYCNLALTTVQPTNLKSHAGTTFSVLPVICGESTGTTWLNAAQNFNVDVITFLTGEGSGLFDSVSEYLSTGRIVQTNKTTISNIERNFEQDLSIYYPSFLEQYAIERSVLNPDGIIVASDSYDGEAGFYPLNRRSVVSWELDANQRFLYGEVMLPRSPRTGTRAQGLGDLNTIAVTASTTNAGKAYFATYSLKGTKVLEMTPDFKFRQINTDGFDSARRYVAWDMEVFNNALYVSTGSTAHHDYSTPDPSRYDQWDAGIWRYDFSTENWLRVGTDGIDGTDNYAISALTTFNGALYAGTSANGGGMAMAGSVYRSTDGTTWTKVSIPWDNWNFGVRDFATFNDALYAVTAKDEAFDDIGASEMWRTTDGTNWEQVIANNGFGDLYNMEMRLQVFNGNLYAATTNWSTGTEIWRSSDGSNWTQVNTDGFGKATNYKTWTMGVFNNTLLVGTQNYQGTEIWKSTNGTTWTKANLSGFKNTLNKNTHTFLAYGGFLFAGTWNGDGAELWRSADLIRWYRVSP